MSQFLQKCYSNECKCSSREADDNLTISSSPYTVCPYVELANYSVTKLKILIRKSRRLKYENINVNIHLNYDELKSRWRTLFTEKNATLTTNRQACSLVYACVYRRTIENVFFFLFQREENYTNNKHASMFVDLRLCGLWHWHKTELKEKNAPNTDFFCVSLSEHSI